MNVYAIILFILMLLYLIYLTFKYKNPVLIVMLLILFVALWPSIRFSIDLIWNVYPYLTYKQGAYDELKHMALNKLNQYFKVHTHGNEYYKEPVIFAINHPIPGQSFISDFCVMNIKSKFKIVKINSGGIVGRLFRNIEHIYINNNKNQTNGLKKDILDSINDGYSIIIYPEGGNCRKKKYWSELSEFKTGTFVISKELNIPIVPVIITGSNYRNGIVHFNDIHIHYLDMIKPKGYDIDQLKTITYNTMKEKMNEIISC